MTSIDVVTLRPVEETVEKQASQEAKDNERKARHAGLNDSESARMIAKIVEEELIKLFEGFVKTDPAGAVCLSILDRIRGKTIDAKHAARALKERHLTV